MYNNFQKKNKNKDNVLFLSSNTKDEMIQRYSGGAFCFPVSPTMA